MSGWMRWPTPAEAQAELKPRKIGDQDFWQDDWISPSDLDARLETMAEEYEWGGDENVTITERERMLLIDFAHGVMADEILVAMLRAHHDPNARGRPDSPPPAEAQPVAWMYRRDNEFPWELIKGEDDSALPAVMANAAERGWEVKPLYAHPTPSAPVGERIVDIQHFGATVVLHFESHERAGRYFARHADAVQVAENSPSAPVGVEDESVRVGNLPTMNQDGYPGLGEWWVQLWRGDEIIARVYGDGPDEVRSQAQDIADALNQQPAAAGEEIMVNAAHDVYTLPLQPSGLSSGPRVVDSEMVTRAVNAYDEATGEGWQMPCLQGMRAALTAALRDHDQETKK